MQKTKTFIGLITLFSLIILAAACGGSSSGGETKTIKSTTVGDKLTVTLSNDTGKLKVGKQQLTLAFTDTSGNPIEISAATLNFSMPAMGSMAEMNNSANLTTTSTPGKFKADVDIEMAGEWIAQISYQGAQMGKTTMALTAY